MKKITFGLVLLLFSIANSFGQIQLGNGTAIQKRVPFEPFFGYSYGQSIYLASEINASGTITSIQWYYNGSAIGNLDNNQLLSVYFGHTTKSAFASNTDWEPAGSLTLVYTGGIQVNGPGWVTLELTQPFEYNGTDNLVVAVTEKEEDFSPSSEDTFLAYEVPANRSLSFYNDGIIPDIDTPPTAEFFDHFVPNVIFGGIEQPCPTPMLVSIGNITNLSATVSWTAPSAQPSGGSAYYIAETNSTPTDSTVPTGTITSGNSVTVSTGLDPATLYYVWVKNSCGDANGNWSYAASFRTECLPIATFNENFDTTAPLTLPSCWSAILRNGASNNASVKIISNEANSAPNTVRIQNQNSAPNADIILVSPKLSTLGTGTHRLKFFADGYSPSNLEIGTLDTFTNSATFTPFDGVETTSNFAEYVVDFTTYTGTDTYVGIRLNATTTNVTVFIDDVRWELAPLCADVASIIVPSVTPETATINWTGGNGVTQWEIVHGATSVTDPSALAPAAVPNVPVTTISGLAPDTSYNVWVRSICGSNLGAWIGPVTFSTSCLPIAIFTENFDATPQEELPGCWTKILRGPTLNEYADVKVSSYNAHSSPNAAYLTGSDSDTSEEDYIILVSPNLSSLGLGTHRVKFFARGEATLEIGTLNSNTNYAEFSSLESYAITNSHTEYTVDFTNYDGTDTFIGFRLASEEIYTELYLDDIRWEIAPLCPDVTEIMVPMVTSNSAEVIWTPDTETEWQVAYGAPTAMDPALLTPLPTVSTNPTVTIANLAVDTPYKVWVRSVCGEHLGAWIGPIAFRTECLPIATFSENFDGVQTPELPGCWSKIVRGTQVSENANVQTTSYNAYSPTNTIEIYNSGSEADHDVILVSPKVNTLSTGTYRLKFYAKSYNPNDIQIGTLDGNTQYASFSEISTITTTTNYQEYIVYFDYAITDTYIGLRLDAPMNSSVSIDNIVWEIAPLCADVSGLVAEETTTNTATISWQSNGTETNWQVTYGAVTETNPDTLTSQPVINAEQAQLSGLEPATNYKVWARSVCGEPNGNGAWIGPILFTTKCIAVNTFDEDFETTAVNSLPNCWTAIRRGEGLSEWSSVKVIDNNSFAGTKTLMIDNSTSDLLADIILVSPNLGNLAAGTHQLTFHVDGNSATAFQIGTLDGNSDNAIFTLWDNYTTTDEYVQMTIDFSDYAGTDTYIGIRHNGAENWKPVYIDTISWQPTLANDSFNNAAFKFYPNPVKNTLNLSYIQNISNVSIFNLLGQKVLENTSNATSAQVDMSGLSGGSYLVKVTADNQTKTIKVVKQ